jgi:hypothetical protein
LAMHGCQQVDTVGADLSPTPLLRGEGNTLSPTAPLRGEGCALSPSLGGKGPGVRSAQCENHRVELWQNVVVQNAPRALIEQLRLRNTLSLQCHQSPREFRARARVN